METELQVQEELWQVEANGGVLDASLGDIANWIEDGSLLKIDRVRKGDLRWIEAGKVPALGKFFNAKDANEPANPTITVSSTEILGRTEAPRSLDGDRRKTTGKWYGPDRRKGGGDRRGAIRSYNEAPTEEDTQIAEMCAIHDDAPAAYVCETCTSQFCKACPQSYGSNVKICPFCGAMCARKDEPAAAAVVQASTVAVESTGKFGFSDLVEALKLPFRFKASLIMGAIMYAFFQIAGGGSPFGGIFMISAGLICIMASNMLTFAVLSNTVDNFAKGELDANFMPSFDDFDLWDDVVHPFFLSIGVYISSFGPFLAVVLFAFFFLMGGIGGMREDAAAKIDPQYAAAPKIVAQGQSLQQFAANTANAQKQRIQSLENGELDPPLDGKALQQAEDQRFEQLDRMIQDARRTQLESTVGKAPETLELDRREMLRKFMSYGLLFLAAAGVTLLWGLFYFPAACAVAGYTRSFSATINPTVGLDTIKRLGGSYVLILVMCLLIALASGFVNGVFGAGFSAFDMPSVGNLPAKFLSSLTGFYFWIVFCGILGYALFRNADKLKLSR